MHIQAKVGEKMHQCHINQMHRPAMEGTERERQEMVIPLDGPTTLSALIGIATDREISKRKR
jgi:hypothetical protein